MKSKSSLFWGIIIIVVGILALINTLGIHIRIERIVLNSIIGGVLILYGITKFTQRRWTFLPFFAFYTGIGFILYVYLKYFSLFLGHIEYRSPWMFVGPAAILAAGSMMVMKDKVKGKETIIDSKRSEYYFYEENTGENKFTDTMDVLNIKNLFNSNVTIATSKQFQGGFISNRFSEATIDLRQVELLQDGILTVENLFGDIQIIVPKHMKVQVVVIENIFASIKERGYADEITGNQQLTINLDVKFGSVKITRL